ncbi:hypothetical protein A9K66_24860 [Mesorhizobium sp. AA23]|nr:hypothetical protein A9K66_24860 [Mesorhizobium sp. AA23]
MATRLRIGLNEVVWLGIRQRKAADINQISARKLTFYQKIGNQSEASSSNAGFDRQMHQTE